MDDQFVAKRKFFLAIVQHIGDKTCELIKLFDTESAKHLLDIISHCLESSQPQVVFQHYVEQYIENCMLLLDECYSLQTGKLLHKLQINNFMVRGQRQFLCQNPNASLGSFSPPKKGEECQRCFASFEGFRVKKKELKVLMKGQDSDTRAENYKLISRMDEVTQVYIDKTVLIQKRMKSNIDILVKLCNADDQNGHQQFHLYNHEVFEFDHGLASFSVNGLDMRKNAFATLKRLQDKTVLEIDGLQLSKHCEDAAVAKKIAEEAENVRREESMKLSNADKEKKRLDKVAQKHCESQNTIEQEKRQAIAAQVVKSIQSNGISSSNSGKNAGGVKDVKRPKIIPAVTQLTHFPLSDNIESNQKSFLPLLDDTSAECRTGEGDTTCDESMSTVDSTTMSSQGVGVGSLTQLTSATISGGTTHKSTPKSNGKQQRREVVSDIDESDLYTSRFLSSPSPRLLSSPMSDNSEPRAPADRRRARRVTGEQSLSGLGDNSDEESIILSKKNHRKRTASEMNTVSAVFPKNLVPESYQLTELQLKEPDAELYNSDLVNDIRHLLTEIEDTGEEDSTPIVSRRESLMQEANKKLDALICKLIENDVAEELLAGLRRDQNTVAYWSMKRHINQTGDNEVIHEINFVHFFKVIKDSLYDRFSFKGKLTRRTIGRDNFIVDEHSKLTKVEGDKNGILSRKINCILHKLGVRFVLVYKSLNERAIGVMEYHDAAFVLTAKPSDDIHVGFDEERIVSLLVNANVSREHMKEFEGLLCKKAPRDTLISMSEKDKQDKRERAAARAAAATEMLEKQVLELLPAAIATGTSAVSQHPLPRSAVGTPSSVQDNASQTGDRSTFVGATTASSNAVGESLSGELSKESHDQASESLLINLFKNSEGVSGKFKVIHSVGEVAKDVQITCAEFVVFAAENLLEFDDENIADLLCQAGIEIVKEFRFEVHMAVSVVGDERTSLPRDYNTTRSDNFDCYRATLQVCRFAEDMSSQPPVSRPIAFYRDEDFNLDPNLLRKHLIQIQNRLKFENDGQQRLAKEAVRSSRYVAEMNIGIAVSSNDNKWIHNLSTNMTTSHMLFLPQRFSFWKFYNSVNSCEPLADVVDDVLCVWARLTILPFVMLNKYSIHPPLVTLDEFRDEVIMKLDLCIMQHKDHYFVAKLVETERDVETEQDLQATAFRNAVRAWAKGVVTCLRSLTQSDIESLLKFCKDSIAHGNKVSQSRSYTSLSTGDLPYCAYSSHVGNIQDIEVKQYLERVKKMEGLVSQRMLYYETQIKDLQRQIIGDLQNDLQS